MSSPTLVRIPHEPLLGFEDGMGDSIHWTTAHAFEPDRFEPTNRVHNALSFYDGDAYTTLASPMGV